MTNKITAATDAIRKSRVLENLSNYDPKVVSTIFAELDIDGSDIDIICCHKEAQQLERVFNKAYAAMEAYSFSAEDDYALGSFIFDGFHFEIYSSTTPVHLQAAYRHFEVMKRLSKIGGDAFKSRIRALKRSGLKTEPAICQLLSLKGDPYSAVLEIESRKEKELTNLIHKSV